MAEQGKPASGSLGFLARKIGPLPVWMWAAIILAAYLAYAKLGPGKKTAAAAAGDAIDPATGVSYAEELAVLQQQLTDIQTGTGASTASTGGGGGSRWRAQPGTTTTPAPVPVTPPPPVTPAPVITVPPMIPAPAPPKKATKEITASGKDDLYKIAAANGLDETDLVQLNPQLKAEYYGTGKPVKAGTKVEV